MIGEAQRNTEDAASHLQGFVGRGSGRRAAQHGAWWDLNCGHPKQTNVVDLEVEDSDALSNLEILEPAHDVGELFSPPRLTRYAPSAGLQPGQAFDLVDGVDLAEVHGRALVAIFECAPTSLCHSEPPCTYFNKLMLLCKGK